MFDAAKLCGGEVGEFGDVGNELDEDLFLIGGSHRNVVEVAFKLVQY